MNKFHVIVASFLLLLMSCSQTQTQPIVRLPAATTPFKEQLALTFHRADGRSEQTLPSAWQLYKREWPTELSLGVAFDASGTPLNCKEVYYQGAGSAERSFRPHNGYIHNITAQTVSVECKLEGALEKLTANFTWEQKPSVSFGEDALARREQTLNQELSNWSGRLERIQTLHLDQEDDAYLRQNNFLSTHVMTLSAEDRRVKTIGGAWRLIKTDGQFSYGVFNAQLADAKGVEVTPRPEGRVDESQPWLSLLCSSNGRAPWSIAAASSSNWQSGEQWCTINHKTASPLLKGQWRLNLVTVKQQEAHAAVKLEVARLQQARQNLLAERNEQQGENDQRIHMYLTRFFDQLKVAKANSERMQPASLCTAELVHHDFLTKESGRMNTDATGEFCGSPILLPNGNYAAPCDGPKAGGREYWGRLFIFDKNLRRLKATIIQPANDEYAATSLESRSKLVARRNDIIGGASDGRLLRFDLKGNLLSQVEFADRPFVEGLAVLPDEGIIALVTDSDDHVSVLTFNKELQLVKRVELSGGGTFPQLQLNQEEWWVSAKNRLYVFDHDGELKREAGISAHGVDLGGLAFRDSDVLVGDENGDVWSVNPETLEAKIFHRLTYSGLSEYSLSHDRYFPQKPSVSTAPVLLDNGRIAVAGDGDGRIHFLSSEGQLELVVSVPFVRSLLNFGAAKLPDGSLGLVATSISYMTVLNQKGEVYTQATNPGGEVFYLPYVESTGRWLVGMYRGVFRYHINTSQRLPVEDVKGFKLCGGETN